MWGSSSSWSSRCHLRWYCSIRCSITSPDLVGAAINTSHLKSIQVAINTNPILADLDRYKSFIQYLEKNDILIYNKKTY